MIHINPNRINVPSGNTGKPGERNRRQANADDAHLIIPKRAHVNHIPAPDSLQTLINSAVAAFRKGVFWDRGTIVNLLV